MAIKLEITIGDSENPMASLEAQMAAFGFIRAPGNVYRVNTTNAGAAKPDSATSVAPEDAARFNAILAAQREAEETAEPERMPGAPYGGTTGSPNNDSPETVDRAVAPLTDMDGDRKRGEAGPGRQRRTREQVESDHAYFAQKKRAEEALAAMDKGVHEDAPAAISSGEPRVNPEDAAQDAADEAAETAARPSEPLTLEHLRTAVARYTDKFGAAATVQNIRAIIGCAVADVPADKIAAAIAAVDMATSGSIIIAPNSPKDGSANSDAANAVKEASKAPAAPPTATKAEFVDAFKAYARRYDGTDDASDNGSKMPITKADVPRIFELTFGLGVHSLPEIPGGQTPENLGKLVAAVKKATTENTFKREVRS